MRSEDQNICYNTQSHDVMAGLVPAIHVFAHLNKEKTWMPGTRPGMTNSVVWQPLYKQTALPHRSLCELKTLEAVQFFLDATLQEPAWLLADPRPFLHQQLLRLAIGFQINRRDDLIANQHR